MLRISPTLRELIQNNIDHAMQFSLKFEEFKKKFLSQTGLESEVDIHNNVVRHTIQLPLLSPGDLTRANIVLAPYPKKKAYLVNFAGDLQLLLIPRPSREISAFTDIGYTFLALYYKQAPDIKGDRHVAIPLRRVFGEPTSEVAGYKNIPYTVKLQLRDGIGSPTRVLDEVPSEDLSGQILFVLKGPQGVLCCGLLDVI